MPPSDKQLSRDVRCSTKELGQAIDDYLDIVNQDPKPFPWTKSADDILSAVRRFRIQTLETADIQPKSSEVQNQDTRSTLYF